MVKTWSCQFVNEDWITLVVLILTMVILASASSTSIVIIRPVPASQNRGNIRALRPIQSRYNASHPISTARPYPPIEEPLRPPSSRHRLEDDGCDSDPLLSSRARWCWCSPYLSPCVDWRSGDGSGEMSDHRRDQRGLRDEVPRLMWRSGTGTTLGDSTPYPARGSAGGGGGMDAEKPPAPPSGCANKGAV